MSESAEGKFWSTTIPPYRRLPWHFVDMHPSLLSTTIPPSQTAAAMRALTREPGVMGMVLKEVKRDPKFPYPPDGTVAQTPLPDDLAPSQGVLCLLASAEFVERLVITAPKPWKLADGVPASSVGLVTTGLDQELAKALKPIPIDAVSASDFAAALTTLKDVLAEETANADRIAFQFDAPAVTMALAAGLDRVKQSAQSDALRPWTALVVDVVVELMTVATHRLKARLRVPRPTDPAWGGIQVPPSKRFSVPAYSAFPAGHASVCTAIARVLAAVCGTGEGPFRGLANDVAKNRERAALHTAPDNEAGATLGEGVADWLIACATGQSEFTVWRTIYAAATQEWKQA